MAWTAFWTDYIRVVKKKCKVRCNPIFIELPKLQAENKMHDLYGNDVLEVGSYQIQEFNELDEATSFFRGCIITDHGFVEQSRGDSKYRYYSLNNYTQQPFVGILYNQVKIKADGEQCIRCKDFVPWAEPDSETGQFVCYCCRTDPYR